MGFRGLKRQVKELKHELYKRDNVRSRDECEDEAKNEE
jgi:hypothetical protein